MPNLSGRLRRLVRYYLEAEPRQRRRMAVLAVLVVLLLGVGGIWVYYLSTRKPLPELLPPAPVIAEAFQPHFFFSIYGVQEPLGVATTPKGDRIYVTESGGERLIRVFDREGNALAAFAPPNSQPPTRAPIYIALDQAGQVYVSDRIRHTVDIYDAGGNFRTTLKPPITDGWSPLGLTFHGNDLYLTEVTEGKHRMLAVNRDGAALVQFGREGQGSRELWFPNAVDVDTRLRIYVSDSNNARVQVFDKAGNLLYTIPGFSLPRGMVIDDKQRLYVVDAVGQGVKVFDISKEKAEPLFSFGDFGMGNGEFNFPNDIAIDGTGRIYIADRANNRVQVWLY